MTQSALDTHLSRRPRHLPQTEALWWSGFASLDHGRRDDQADDRRGNRPPGPKDQGEL